MKKVLGALALLVVVLIVVWGYRTAKDALLAPVPLVQGMVGPYDIVFGKPAASGGAKDARAAQTKTLEAAGIKSGASFAMWMTKGSAETRSGAVLGRADLPRARKLGREFQVVHLAAQKGWIASGAGMASGAVAMGLAMGRSMGSLIGKAQALGWPSYIVVSRFEGETAESVIVPAPK